MEGVRGVHEHGLIEEAGSIPEMKLYTEWLQRASPGATPDFFGIYAWSAFRLFQKLATQIGPDLTRAKLLAALKATKEWGANGLHAPHQTGAKIPSSCNLNLVVRGGKFVREFPGFRLRLHGRALPRLSPEPKVVVAAFWEALYARDWPRHPIVLRSRLDLLRRADRSVHGGQGIRTTSRHDCVSVSTV